MSRSSECLRKKVFTDGIKFLKKTHRRKTDKSVIDPHGIRNVEMKFADNAHSSNSGGLLDDKKHAFGSLQSRNHLRILTLPNTHRSDNDSSWANRAPSWNVYIPLLCRIVNDISTSIIVTIRYKFYINHV